MRVSRLDGRVTLTMPDTASERRALAFANEKAAWIRGRLAERPDEVHAMIGAVIPVDGVEMQIISDSRSRLDFDRGEIAVSRRSSAVHTAVAGLLRAHARERLSSACDRYSSALGRPYSRITLRDTRSRWGSCSAEGALMFSWRLILAPPVVLDYVAAHEVAHLKEMNHSARFWSTVEKLMPEYKPHRAWLRRNGEELHRYRFTEPPH